MLLIGCSVWPGKKTDASAFVQPCELMLTLDAAAYGPGQAVVCEAVLTCPDAQEETVVPMPDATTISFSLQAVDEKAVGETRRVEPVSSPVIPAAEPTPLAPGASIRRSFVFPALTFERGSFLLQAVYTLSVPGSPELDQKIYARAVPFAVAGEKAFVHRYLNGLLTREDALRVAAEAAGRPPVRSEALLVRDELQLLKWWVNLDFGADPAKPERQSCFVDPYLARVWKQAQPFTAADRDGKDVIPEDSKKFDELRQKWETKK
jgi:hypothetical protein